MFYEHAKIMDEILVTDVSPDTIKIMSVDVKLETFLILCYIASLP